MGKKQTSMLIDSDLHERFILKHGDGKLSGFLHDALLLDCMSSEINLELSVAKKKLEATRAKISPDLAEIQQLESFILAQDIKAKQSDVLTAEEQAIKSDPSLKCEWCGVSYSENHPKLFGADRVGKFCTPSGHVCARCALDDLQIGEFLQAGLSVDDIKKKLRGD